MRKILLFLFAIFVFFNKSVFGQTIEVIPKNTVKKSCGYIYFLHLGPTLKSILPFCISDIKRPEYKTLTPETPLDWFSVSQFDLGRVYCKTAEILSVSGIEKGTHEFGTFRIIVCDGKDEKDGFLSAKSMNKLLSDLKIISSGKYLDMDSELNSLEERLKNNF